MSLLSCFLGNSPSKWLTNPDRLKILMRIFLLILASCARIPNPRVRVVFYKQMKDFVELANEYLIKYESLTETSKKSYQNKLHEKLKNMSADKTYIIGGKWGQSWTSSQLYVYYDKVIHEIKTVQFIVEIGKLYKLPDFNYKPSSDPKSLDKIEEIKRNIVGILFVLPIDMRNAYPIIFQSDSHQSDSQSKALNVPPPVVSKPFQNPSENWTHLGGAISALNKFRSLATPRYTDTERSPPTCDDPIHVPAITPREIYIPRTPRSPRYSNWLLENLLSYEFLYFLQQQSQQSRSQQLIQMFELLRLYFANYYNEILIYQNLGTIRSFFDAFYEYTIVKTALELYHGEPLDNWMDIRIVSESNQEDQKRFYEYLKMIIHLKVWLCDDDAGKKYFSYECDRKSWGFDELLNSLYFSDLPESSIIGEQLPIA